MPVARYIYVNDQGRVFCSEDDPTAEDFAYAEVGMVTILRLADTHYYRRDGKWWPVTRGKLASSEIDGISTEKFHSDPAVRDTPVASKTALPNSRPRKISGRSWTGPKPANARRRGFTSS